MHVDLTLNFSLLYGFLLVLARVSGVIAFVPIPGVSAGPEASRIVLALALTIALYPVWPVPAVDGPVVGTLLGWVASEAAFGLTVGVAIAFLLEGVQMAAQMIGLQAGYSFASTVDPTTQADTTSLQLMAQLLGGSLFFAFGFDLQVIRILAKSLETNPGGTYALNGNIVEAVTRLGSAIFVTGLQLAAPVLALLLLLDIAFAVLGRLQPQLQLLSLSFSIKMLVGMAFLTSVLSFFPAVLARSGAATFQMLLRVMVH
ncbi:MAG TPA: flagellar biosynthetic protein FliR [Bryobacteraceae bacterium]|nr:flagellar biosynthetic protein FliR [Bryobacteraceae bacterium]